MTAVATTETALETLVDRMARREVAAHFLIPADQPPGVIRPPAPPMTVHILTCPVCGADGTTFAASGVTLPFAEWRIAGAHQPTEPGLPTMTVLGCEWFAPRAVLPVAIAIERFGPAAASRFRSRGVALLDSPDLPFEAGLAQLDRQESWLGTLLAGGPGPLPEAPAYTVPAATRLVGPAQSWAAYRDTLTARFAGPHTSDIDGGRWNDAYLEIRRITAAQTLQGYATCPA
ncbi:hypothetical protein KZ829_22055 [Actinoplanes hulinensis]|uniref:Uncharacterized protein n=1 Tax=Actinoplanes hulinensis TaxID=1144547 RepID=A0ABS7B666_9ACTN|nr:hypothetical protein [Actinoplanes hulinensis]MBW6436428.1 hypothetical protein [Actinoplanes hulinensis]